MPLRLMDLFCDMHHKNQTCAPRDSYTGLTCSVFAQDFTTKGSVFYHACAEGSKAQRVRVTLQRSHSDPELGELKPGHPLSFVYAYFSSLICYDCLNVADINIILLTHKKLSIKWSSNNHLHMDSSLGCNPSSLSFLFILNWFYFETVSYMPDCSEPH